MRWRWPQKTAFNPSHFHSSALDLAVSIRSRPKQIMLDELQLLDSPLAVTVVVFGKKLHESH